MLDSHYEMKGDWAMDLLAGPTHQLDLGMELPVIPQEKRNILGYHVAFNEMLQKATTTGADELDVLNLQKIDRLFALAEEWGATSVMVSSTLIKAEPFEWIPRRFRGRTISLQFRFGTIDDRNAFEKRVNKMS